MDVGPEIVGRWREAGRWWDGEPSLEVVQTGLPSGKESEEIREAEPVGARLIGAGRREFAENASGGAT